MGTQKREKSRQNKPFMIVMTGSAHTRFRFTWPLMGNGSQTEERMSDQRQESEYCTYQYSLFLLRFSRHDHKRVVDFLLQAFHLLFSLPVLRYTHHYLVCLTDFLLTAYLDSNRKAVCQAHHQLVPITQCTSGVCFFDE